MSTENGYTGVFPSIYDVTSRPQDNLVLSYGTSNDDEINILAFRVERSIRRIERVTNGPTIADGGNLDFGYFGTNGHTRDVADPGNEVFRIESDRNRSLVEYGFALPDVDDVYIGLEAGDGGAVVGLSEGSDRLRQFSAQDFEQRGAPKSQETRVEANGGTEIPSTRLSTAPDQGIIRLDSRQDGNNPFRFAFANRSGGQITANVIGMGMAYEVRPLYDREEALDMLAGDGYNRRLLTYGGFDNTNPNLPRQWYNAAHTVPYGEVGPAFNPP
mgnify:CR=1 FL=1